MINRRNFLGSLAAASFVAGPAAARPSDVFAKSGYAIGGIDPVAYFRKAMPVDGENTYRLRWHRAIWRFENAANMPHIIFVVITCLFYPLVRTNIEVYKEVYNENKDIYKLKFL